MHCTQVETKKGKKWVCVADGPPDPITGKRNQIVRRGKTKKEAMERVQKEIDDIEEHGLLSAEKSKIVFEKFAKEWLETYSPNVKISTVHVRLKEIKTLNKYIAKVKIEKVTPKMYQNILNDLHKKGYARSTIIGVHSSASMIFRQAVIWKMITTSPTNDAVIPKDKITVEEIESNVNPIEKKYLEKNELKEFLEVTTEHGLPNDKEIFFILAFTGIRVGELCALKWSDVDFELGEIRITKTIFSPKNSMKDYSLLTPKTTTSIRRIKVDEYIIDLLRNHKDRQKAKKTQKQEHHADFLIARPNGYPYLEERVNERMQRIMKRTSIAKHATPHTLRHTHVSILTESGIDIKTIMDRVGHKDMKTTMQIYTHVTQKMKSQANEKFNKFMSDLLSN
ncbi:tyrosine-type recombinase/integrase [Paenibacillus thiaminolyticus]|uniref:tyrosine-type recombinase/integrase n=1 Tax=Paenibacillus thiaminolyticus TaxID=49283 RepID=UPI0035A73B24